jgi:CHAD domain-containing protein
MADILKSYYLEHKLVFEENFRQVLESFETEAIHKMRTSTKRLRALFQLIEFLSEKKFKAKKQLFILRTLFKHGGKIREIQIEELLVLQYEQSLNKTFPEYLAYLKWRKHKEMAGFLKSRPALKESEAILSDQKVSEAISILPTGQKLKLLTNAFIEDRVRRIRVNIKNPTSNHRIHQNRTFLKQIYYLYEILTTLSGLKMILHIDAERIREMEQYLGTWHDLVNSPVFMNAFFQTKGGISTGKYKALKHRIADDRKEMRNYIIQVYFPELSAQTK